MWPGCCTLRSAMEFAGRGVPHEGYAGSMPVQEDLWRSSECPNLLGVVVLFGSGSSIVPLMLGSTKIKKQAYAEIIKNKKQSEAANFFAVSSIKIKS